MPAFWAGLLVLLSVDWVHYHTQRLLRHGYEWWLAAFSSCTGIFGGYNLGDLNDTWEWDGFDWVLVNTANSPSPRRAMSPGTVLRIEWRGVWFFVSKSASLENLTSLYALRSWPM